MSHTERVDQVDGEGKILSSRIFPVPTYKCVIGDDGRGNSLVSYKGEYRPRAWHRFWLWLFFGAKWTEIKD